MKPTVGPGRQRPGRVARRAQAHTTHHEGVAPRCVISVSTLLRRPMGPARKTCSRCGEEKPSSSFYKNPRSICKSCHNKASRFTGACRRAAIAHLISTYSTEYRVLVEAERSRRRSTIEPPEGGASDVA